MMKHSQEQLSKELQTRWNYEPYLIEGLLEKLFAMAGISGKKNSLII